MEDVPRLPYLVGKNGDQKFKRNVPRDLVKLAGKTAWVERLKGRTASDVREQGHLFAISTDAEIKRLRKRREGTSIEPVASAEFSLDETGAKQIALAYFRSQHDANIANGTYFSSQNDPDYAEILSDAAEGYRQASLRVEGEVREEHPAMARLLLEHGLVNEQTVERAEEDGWPELIAASPAFRSLTRRLELCDLELARILNVGLREGELPRKLILEPGFHAPSQSGVPSQSKSGVTIKQLVDEFLAAKKPEVTASRYNQFKIPGRALMERLGAKRDVAMVTRAEARELCEFLPKIPAHTSKLYPKLTLAKAAIRYEREHGAPANRWGEAQKHLAVISRMFVHARNEGYVQKNWFDGLQIKPPRDQRAKHAEKEATTEPFTVDELNRLFAQPQFFPAVQKRKGTALDHHHWAPIIALFSGMRMNEILQLENSDLVEIGGVWVFSVTDEMSEDYADGDFSKRLKTKNSVRLVPVHPMLSKLGLLRQAHAAPKGRLFPEATKGGGEKPSDKYSKQFARVLKKADVWVPRRKVFHSFRNTFTDALRAADVPLEFREAICGWSENKSMDRRYGSGYPIERLADAVSRVSYPGLRLPGL